MTRAIIPFIFILPSLAYSLLALLSLRAFFKREPPGGTFTPAVSIIKPIKGLDTGTRQSLESFCLQKYPLYQIVFALQSLEDQCVPVIRQLMADYPEIDSELVINAAVHGANGKVSNLINAFPLVKHDIIIIADSDIRVEVDYLAKLAGHFSAAHVGLVTSLYRGANVFGAAAALEALGFTAEMMPNVIVAERLEGLSFALGASMAVRREALEAIGGFSALADYLADDYQLGNMIHKAGWQLALSGDFVESVMQRESLAMVVSRQLRWCRTMRVSRPFGYLASGITQPVLGILAVSAFAGFTCTALVAATILYVVRGGRVRAHGPGGHGKAAAEGVVVRAARDAGRRLLRTAAGLRPALPRADVVQAAGRALQRRGAGAGRPLHRRARGAAVLPGRAQSHPRLRGQPGAHGTLRAHQPGAEGDGLRFDLVRHRRGGLRRWSAGGRWRASPTAALRGWRLAPAHPAAGEDRRARRRGRDAGRPPDARLQLRRVPILLTASLSPAGGEGRGEGIHNSRRASESSTSNRARGCFTPSCVFRNRASSATPAAFRSALFIAAHFTSLTTSPSGSSRTRSSSTSASQYRAAPRPPGAELVLEHGRRVVLEQLLLLGGRIRAPPRAVRRVHAKPEPHGRICQPVQRALGGANGLPEGQLALEQLRVEQHLEQPSQVRLRSPQAGGDLRGLVRSAADGLEHRGRGQPHHAFILEQPRRLELQRGG